MFYNNIIFSCVRIGKSLTVGRKIQSHYAFKMYRGQLIEFKHFLILLWSMYNNNRNKKKYEENYKYTNKGTNIESNTDEKDNNQIALGLNVLFAVHND